MVINILIETLQDSLEGICTIVICFLDFISFCLDLRFCTSFFLNLNPYYEPLFTVLRITSHFLYMGRNIYPKIMGVDVTIMVNYRLLNYVRKQCQYVIENIKEKKLINANDVITSIDGEEKNQYFNMLQDEMDSILNFIEKLDLSNLHYLNNIKEIFNTNLNKIEVADIINFIEFKKIDNYYNITNIMNDNIKIIYDHILSLIC
jgi:uncharacterized protein YggT (Ycf19 family)